MSADAGFAVIIPMANEAADFHPFLDELMSVMDSLRSGTVYFVVDRVSKDETLSLCNGVSDKDPRFVTLWSPENRNVVDAYMKVYRTAYDKGHRFIMEMDAGLSHDPKAIPMFLKALNNGWECAFGSRFISGGSMDHSTCARIFLSKYGTLLSNVLLGTRMHDMMSGFQGFQASVVKEFIDYKLLSKADFYQTELRYLLRNKRCVEIPIRYKAPSPSVSKKAIVNSIEVLLFYFLKRLSGHAAIIH
jgi:dolichol-phosphate mannosyltransferase